MAVLNWKWDCPKKSTRKFVVIWTIEYIRYATWNVSTHANLAVSTSTASHFYNVAHDYQEPSNLPRKSITQPTTCNNNPKHTTSYPSLRRRITNAPPLVVTCSVIPVNIPPCVVTDWQLPKKSHRLEREGGLAAVYGFEIEMNRRGVSTNMKANRKVKSENSENRKEKTNNHLNQPICAEITEPTTNRQYLQNKKILL